jgi:UTP-glucose-1-phosphate uridylyltransferase
MGEMKIIHKTLVEKPEEKRPREDLDVDGRIILE